MRKGRAGDLPGLVELWREDVRARRRDCVPGERQIRSMLAGFDWEAKSRIADGAGGALDGAVLVFNRATELPVTIAVVEASVVAGRNELLDELTGWGFGFSKAAGAGAVQVWRGKGDDAGLRQLGLEPIRTWWRMDMVLGAQPTGPPSPVAGYQLRHGTNVPSKTWTDVHNRAFADHWRFFPRTERELMAGRPPELSLMAVAGGSPAAVTLAQIEVYQEDPRPQPVGVISSVGTLNEHRRRGLATWLVAEALVRLQRSGARSASLYVDGQSPMRAFDAYLKLGFELAFETEVWEATFR